MIRITTQIDADGNIMRDERGVPVTVEVEMTAEEIAAFEAERAAPPIERRYSPLQFMDLFTDDEQLAIVTATLANPAVKLWYDKMLAAHEINLNDARVTAGLAALAAAGLISEARIAELTA